MNKLTRIPKIAVFCLAALVVLGSGGVAFASFNHSLDVTGFVQACHDGHIIYASDYVHFIWAVSNDNAGVENQGGYYPIDRGDNGLDPAGSLIPYTPPPAQSPGQTCNRYDKNVAATTASVNSDDRYITTNLNNAYPYYHPTVFFGLRNGESSQGTVDSILITNAWPDDVTLRVNGIALGQVIASGEEVYGSLDVQVEQAASQNWAYTFKIDIALSGEPIGGPCGEQEGTPGFWCNNWEHFYRECDLLSWLRNIDSRSRWINDPTGRTWTVQDMENILNAGVGNHATARTRFLRHYLATRLNVCSGRLDGDNRHNITGIDGYRKLGLNNPRSTTLTQIMNAIESKYNLSNPADPLFNVMKDICDALNNLRI